MEKLNHSNYGGTYMVGYFCSDFYSGFRCDVLLYEKMYVDTLAAGGIQILPKILPKINEY